MTSFQQMPKQKQSQCIHVHTASLDRGAICNVEKLLNDLKRFHPAGQTETSMDSVIRDSR
ncbi:hypothetical protein D3OALGA1CA_5689 [Olavius algarvensis associated proteobacterium Delta 3]|nr:hypothetical protein D3OALGB2SA_3254 [Olavius algarvensis associated proteobacterium Delta 3]CAB5170254.1 hypothetical protein D3OALGA1CA_5689 [Olavius algarvensis associated proteobacterium Delta 3]